MPKHWESARTLLRGDPLLTLHSIFGSVFTVKERELTRAIS